jgi:hypothetical protein
MPIRSRAVCNVGPATASDGIGIASIPGPDAGNSPRSAGGSLNRRICMSRNSLRQRIAPLCRSRNNRRKPSAYDIRLSGLRFGNKVHDPGRNLKTYVINEHEITLVAQDQKIFTDSGVIERIDEAPGTGMMDVTIDSEAWGWYGTAQFSVVAGNGRNILNDNFQSGVRGPVGDPCVVKHYRIDNIG